MRDDEEFRGSGTPYHLDPEAEQRLDEALRMERVTHSDESEEALTQRLFKENGARVAMGLVNIALKSPNERIRLDASKYVVDRVLGPLGKETYRAESPLEKLVAQMQQDTEDFANEGKA